MSHQGRVKMGKGKSVLREVTQGQCPVPEEGQELARVAGARGGNIVEVELRGGDSVLVRMPSKFVKTLWVRTGGFVIVARDESIQEGVSGEIANILYPDQVKELKKMKGVWPEEFDDEVKELHEPGRLMEVGERKAFGAAYAGQGAGGAGGAIDEGDEGAGGAGEGGEGAEEEGYSSDDGLPPLESNPNHRVVEYSDDSDSD